MRWIAVVQRRLLDLRGWPTPLHRLVVARILDRVMTAVEQWAASGGDVHGSGILDSYRSACSTVGQRIRVERPGGLVVMGIAVDIDPSGGLVVDSGDGEPLVITAGDVVHVRAEF
jgi:BirA family biotin operon repressor/biotin-[acetyl-CoA-carboxylase] ligase